MASIRKDPRGKSPYWYACFTLPDGRRTQRSTGTKDRGQARRIADQMEDATLVARKGRMTETAARRVAADIYQIVNKDKLPASNIRSYFERWLERKAIENVESTHTRYSITINQVLDYLGDLADKDISYFDSKVITEIRDRMAKEKSPATANHTVKTLRAALNQARRDGLVDQNEASKVTLIKHRSNKRMAFKIEEIQHLLEVADDEWRGIIIAGLYTGQRLGDIATLTWANINLQTKQIHLVTRKQGRSTSIPIAEPLFNHLEHLPAGDDPNAPLFPNAYRTVTTQQGRSSTLSGQFHRIMESAGLVPKRTWKSTGKGRDKKRQFSPLSFHSLRHTATTLFKEAGVAHAVVQDIIGHDSEAVSRVYTHVGDQAKSDAIRKLPQIKLS